MVPAIEVSCLSKAYVTPVETVHAVHELSLKVSEGDFVRVSGASGSGKTTLIRLIAGLLPADSGTVRVGGKELTAMTEGQKARPRLETIGVVFQDDNLVPEFTALENVSLPVEARRWATDRARSEAQDALERVGLADLGHRFPAELSGGQRQRVGVARALVGGRRILIADEPTGSLDSANSQMFFELVRKLCIDGASALVASHDPECDRFATRSVAMRDGVAAEIRIR